MLQLRIVADMLFAAVAVSSAPGYSQDFPSKPVRIIVAAPGGGSDFAARIIAQSIAGPLGQQVIVDYRGGGVLSSEYVAKSPPDGYTLHVTGGLLWILPLLRAVPYDAVRDFAPITLLSQEPSIVAVHPSLRVKSVKELIALAKARPGELNYGSTGVGATSHLVPELFKSMAGINMVHVPYKGNAAAVTALVGGELQVVMLDASAVASQIKAGRLRALAVTSATPSVLFPDLPTVAASGLPGFESVGRTGIWAPAKTPAAVIDRLNQEIVRALNQPSVKEQFLKAGVETVGNAPDQFAAIIKSEIAKMGKVVKDANIRAE
jgi:tripartite-type tricarboxylate transporter receptor subunit TctC